VDNLLTLLVITLIGLPVSKVTIDELALDLQRHGEETIIGKRQGARRKFNVI
jgi:bacillopeptidase F (M6 metalloprotease family)